MEFKIRTLISGDATGGRMAAFEEATTTGAGPPMHVNREQVEVFHVIRGRHRFVVGGVETEAAEGACLVVPMGVPHTFQNMDSEKGLIHFELLPAQRSEEFFTALVTGEFDPKDAGEFFTRYGMDLVGPPLP
jgi:quercetin dioxygenase-like cupin family protein